MKYIVVKGGKYLHKVTKASHLDEETCCGLPVKKSDTVYLNRRPPQKIVLNCPECFTPLKDKKREAHIQGIYNQAAYWGWSKTRKSPVAVIIEKPKTIKTKDLPMLDVPAARLLITPEDDEETLMKTKKV